jgi:hypothetical protein
MIAGDQGAAEADCRFVLNVPRKLTVAGTEVVVKVDELPVQSAQLQRHGLARFIPWHRPQAERLSPQELGVPLIPH